MIFIVPEDFKGSFVLSTLKKALSKGMTISIEGNKLYAPDVKMAIQNGILVSMDEEYDYEKGKLNYNEVVVNLTDKVLVLGEIVLRSKQALSINKDLIKTPQIRAAEKNGLIRIVSDETKKKAVKKKITKKKTTKKKVIKKKVVKKKTKKKVAEEVEEFTPGAERQVTAKVWNFREQEQADAQIVPKTPDIHYVDEAEVEEIDFVDEPLEVQEIAAKKKTAKKKTAKKKAVKKKIAKKTIKKKGKATKKKKVKAIELVGDRKMPKTQMDAIIELDSRGNPIEKASDMLQHLIDSLEESEDVSFVDGEQAQERYNKRIDMD